MWPTWPAPAAQGGGDIDLFDVHVKQVAQQLDVASAQRLEQLDAVGNRVDEVGFVTVEWLVQQRHAVLIGVLAQLVERFAQQADRPIAGDAVSPAALHRADNRRRTERAGNVDDCADVGRGPLANRRVGMRQVQMVQHPTCASADGRQTQFVTCEQRFQFIDVYSRRRRRKNFYCVEAHVGRGLAAGFQVVPKHEWTAASLTDQADCHARANHAGLLWIDSFAFDMRVKSLRRSL